MLDALITSKTRIKLLMRFFLNPELEGYLRGLETEFGESTNAIRLELNRFENAGMLLSALNGNKKVYRANKKHPLFREIREIILKHVGIDRIIDQVVERLGDLHEVYLTGDYARGMDSGIIDLVFVGNINQSYLIRLIEKAEGLISRRVRYIVFSPGEFHPEVNSAHSFVLLWKKEEERK